MESHGHEAAATPLWSAAEMEHFERRLLEERKRAVAQLADFDDQLGTTLSDAASELTTWRFHMADIGSDTYEREQASLLASREGRLLWHIDAALRKLYHSPASFGRCEECGKPIGYDRLDAIPYVTRCVDCKQDWEEGARAD